MAEQLKQFHGTILEQGYGIVAKLVMRDRNLHGMAKALYAYLCTFGNVVFPGRELICKDLGITVNTYTKYLNSLVKHGYIIIEREKPQSGKFGRNIYHINQLKSPCIKKRDMVLPDMVNCDTNNTSVNKTSLKNTTTNKKAAVVISSATPGETDTEERALISKAEALGVKKLTTAKYIRQKGLSAVAEQVANLEKAIIRGNSNGKPVVNPGALLYTALEEGFTNSRAQFEKEQAIKKTEAQEKVAAIQKAAEEALFAEVEQAPAIDPASPFAQMAARIGAIKAM